MRMQKRQFRIGEFAKHLNIERFVVRFWEKEFNLKTDRSLGGQRFYSEEDLDMFKQIKELLYNKGFTIAGAKQQIFRQPEPTIIASKKTIIDYTEQDLLQLKTRFNKEKKHLINQLLDLRQQLHKLQNLL